MSTVTLFDYWRSTASYRVRIALNLAGISYDTITVNLLDKSNKSPEHIARNPQGLVPVLDIDGQRFTQSIAIIEYLNETRNLNLLPANAAQRAKARALVQVITADIHPVCNLSVVSFATNNEEPARTKWMKQFITPGLAAIEKLLAEFEQKAFAISNEPSLVDICLIPQIYNAKRWGVDYENCSRIKSIISACDQHPAFIASVPSKPT